MKKLSVVAILVLCSCSYQKQILRINEAQLSQVGDYALQDAKMYSVTQNHEFLDDNHPVSKEIRKRNALKIRTADNNRLCQAYYESTDWPHDQVKKELIKRKLIASWEWKIIDTNKIKIGMSECGLYASWGGATDTNASTYSFGTHKQIIYRPILSNFGGTYVYTENGKITSWQD